MPKRVKVRAPRCPNCPYAFVASAHYRWYERPLALVLRRPYRCRSCGARYIGRFYVGHIVAEWLRNRAL